MAKILVTGGLGLIGHNVVQQLESQEHTCVITDTQTNYGIIPQSEIEYLIAERRKKIATDRIYGIDVGDSGGIDYLMRINQIDTVIHLASFPRQKVVNADPQWGSRVMSEGLLNLLECSVKNNVEKFVYVSSSMVYGDFKENNISESHPTNPIGQYGIMKLAGEWLVRDYTRRTGMSHVILRPSAVYGPLDVEDRVISKFILAAMRGGELRVNGAAETLDFTYVEDAAAGIVAATLAEQANNRTYNITKSHSTSLLEAAELAVKIAGGGTINIGNKDTDFPSRGALNTRAAQQDFGFNPKVDVEEGFQRYYEWLKDSVYWSQKTV